MINTDTIKPGSIIRVLCGDDGEYAKNEIMLIKRSYRHDFYFIIECDIWDNPEHFMKCRCCPRYRDINVEIYCDDFEIFNINRNRVIM